MATTLSEARQQAERKARIQLIMMAVPDPFIAGIVFWVLGIDVHPHRIAYACVVTGCALLLAMSSAWLVYHQQMTRARKL
jgi:hypothetical protein